MQQITKNSEQGSVGADCVKYSVDNEICRFNPPVQDGMSGRGTALVILSSCEQYF